MTQTLSERLDRIREGASQRIPPEALTVMHAATEELERSGLADRAVGVGDAAPGFSLPATDGSVVTLDELRARGPVVLTFFRGHW